VRHTLLAIALGVALLPPVVAQANPQVTLETNQGAILIELDPATAPLSVENFLGYVRAGFYDGTVFHRVIDGFMIQGGGFTEGLQRKETRPPIQNESSNRVKNARGTIAMARTNDPHSATAQFFISLADNAFLDHGRGDTDWGYAVFGKVIEGMEIVDAIGKVPTGIKNGMQDVPNTSVVVVKATATP
jgi:peptidyl-prolyl cis-trans isomerase B (cyclophilin B)